MPLTAFVQLASGEEVEVTSPVGSDEALSSVTLSPTLVSGVPATPAVGFAVVTSVGCSNGVIEGVTRKHSLASIVPDWLSEEPR